MPCSIIMNQALKWIGFALSFIAGVTALVKQEWVIAALAFAGAVFSLVAVRRARNA